MLRFQLCAEESPTMLACRRGVDCCLDDGDGDVTLRLCFGGLVFQCQWRTACRPCLHEGQRYSHECGDEVTCEPEVVVKVPAGRGGGVGWGGEVLLYRNS